MPSPRKYKSKKDLLWDLAVAHSGYFSAREAAELGIGTAHLSYYHRRGHIELAFRGVYRLTRFPPGDHEDLTIVWLASDTEAVFSHETALQLHHLSDVLPNRIHVSLPPSWRRRLLPAGVERNYIKAPITERCWVGDVPVTTPARTLADCNAAHVSAELILQALHQARSRGLIDEAQASSLAPHDYPALPKSPRIQGSPRSPPTNIRQPQG